MENVFVASFYDIKLSWRKKDYDPNLYKNANACAISFLKNGRDMCAENFMQAEQRLQIKRVIWRRWKRKWKAKLESAGSDHNLGIEEKNYKCCLSSSSSSPKPYEHRCFRIREMFSELTALFISLFLDSILKNGDGNDFACSSRNEAWLKFLITFIERFFIFLFPWERSLYDIIKYVVRSTLSEIFQLNQLWRYC
jgi:hypothetical protein